ncbi:hypothetical protein [Chitinophaga tropicalis]|uniref:Uncharacterized protein n=1 Tax=Chitinophaga tropicalis TaxID=2683588 RepID=A0A7K1U531_9BACT|nr:hypothetical protein [Chitinophaga tropicalis]MVT09474.1 hypothetical protein [Chitinophaga tropicalis]
MSQKSFYDLEYLIEINEKRIEEYISAYQKILERLTNIVIVYSALAIFFIPICQDLFQSEITHWLFISSFVIFVGLFSFSLYFTIRLIIPEDVAYLGSPKRYYNTLRWEYEQLIEKQSFDWQENIDKQLQASYVGELERILTTNIRAFVKKSSFYYNALTFSLLSAVPFLICLGFHIMKKEDKIQKVKIIKQEKILNLHLYKLDSIMYDAKKTNSGKPPIKFGTTSNLPGVDNSKVIPSSPFIIRENSSKIRKMKDVPAWWDEDDFKDHNSWSLLSVLNKYFKKLF